MSRTSLDRTADLGGHTAPSTGRGRARRSIVATVLCCCLLSGTPKAAGCGGDVPAILDAIVQPLLKEHDIPGLAVAVTIDGTRTIRGYGVASKEGGEPVTGDTVFEIGSLSKTFTATLVSYVRALGALSLDDHPSRFMPQLRGTAIDEASLLDLGTYTAGGLPLQFPDGVAGDQGMLDYYRQWTRTASPGTQRRYSNPSIGLLGHVAALAVHRDFAELMDTEVLPKLGLGDTRVRISEAMRARYAWGYDAAGKPVRVNPGVLDAQAYGVKSTAADMIRFVEANIRPEQLDPPMRQAVEETQIGYVRVGDLVQGLGWEQFDDPIPRDRLLAGNAPAMTLQANAATRLAPPRAPSGPTLFDKTGSTNGFGAYVAFVPHKRIGIVILANRNYPIAARITAAHAVLERLCR